MALHTQTYMALSSLRNLLAVYCEWLAVARNYRRQLWFLCPANGQASYFGEVGRSALRDEAVVARALERAARRVGSSAGRESARLKLGDTAGADRQPLLAGKLRPAADFA